VQIDSITKAVPSYGELSSPSTGYLRCGIDHRDNCPECDERGFEGMFIMRGRGTISVGVEWRASLQGHDRGRPRSLSPTIVVAHDRCRHCVSADARAVSCEFHECNTRVVARLRGATSWRDFVARLRGATLWHKFAAKLPPATHLHWQVDVTHVRNKRAERDASAGRPRRLSCCRDHSPRGDDAARISASTHAHARRRRVPTRPARPSTASAPGAGTGWDMYIVLEV
jgi:hypothetical protein